MPYKRSAFFPTESMKIRHLDLSFKKWLYLGFQDRQSGTFSNARPHIFIKLKIRHFDPSFKKWLYLAFQDRQSGTFSNARPHIFIKFPS